MEYQGKLYGKVGKSYFPLEATLEDFDNLQNKLKEYEEKLRWTPIDELHNPTIPFLGKDKSGKIELFKVANVFYLKALDVVEWRSIL